MNVIVVLETYLPKAVAEIIVGLNLGPTLISHGINFDDKDSRDNGILVAARYELKYICDYDSYERIDFSQSLNVDIWDAIAREVESMRRNGSLTRFSLNVNCKAEAVDGEIILLGQAVDPIKGVLERTRDNEDAQCTDCKEMLPLEGTTLCSSCIPTNYVFPMDKELKRRVRRARLTMEFHHVTQKIESWVKTKSGEKYRFRFDRTYYAFSNQKGEIEKIKSEIEPLFSQEDDECW